MSKPWKEIIEELDQEQLKKLALKQRDEIDELARLLTLYKEVSVHQTRLATMGEMCGGIAHEINNPLTIINGSLFLLERQFQKKDARPEVIAGHFERIHETVSHISSVVVNMRAMVVKCEGTAKQVVKINDLFCKSLIFCETKFKNRSIKLESICQQGLSINCQPTQITQVLLNLFSNSFHAIKDLEIERWISIKAWSENNLIYIRVIDSGNGIDNEHVKSIFTPYYTTKSIDEGTGVGLSISKKIVEEHQGTLEYKLVDGNTCFEMSFPFPLEKKS
ncbi:MAG: GHKL domain-containing protein [Bacteriovoracaceae bacterium]|nr:GHKL domain-containing protein [Bacteriovoracaceae bacterium]